MNIRLRNEGAIHENWFSWMTKCGLIFGDDERPDYEITEKSCTCKRCKNTRNVDITFETSEGFGILIEHPTKSITNQLRASTNNHTVQERTQTEIQWLWPILYRIRIFLPYNTEDAIHITARLPDDRAAKVLSANIVFWWRQQALRVKEEMEND